MTPSNRRACFVRVLASVLLCSALHTAPASAQLFRGVLSERDTYTPIELGSVTLLTAEFDTLAQVITTEDGFFTFTAPDEGEYYLIASALGYRPVRSDLLRVAEDEVQIVELSMTIRPVRLGGIVVEAEGEEPENPSLAATGFYERLDAGWGEFLTPGEVARHPAAYTSQLFREMLTVDLARATGVSGGPWNDRILLESPTIGACEPDLFIDDVFTELMPGESLHDAAPKEEIEAIEVFIFPFGPPMRYFRKLGLEACGTVLIWTKRR